MSANKTVIHNVIEEAWNKGNLGVLEKHVAADYLRRVPGDNVRGITGFRERIMNTRRGFPDFHSKIDQIIEEGDSGVILWTATATHEGEINGIPPTGKKLTWSGMTWYRNANGKLAEEWELYDQFEMLQALGVIPDSD